MKDRRPIITTLVIVLRDRAEMRIRTPYTPEEIRQRFSRPANGFVSFESIDPDVDEVDSVEHFVRVENVQAYSIAKLAQTDITIISNRHLQ